MIKLPRLILFIISSVWVFSTASAEDSAASSAQLKSGDIQQFIKTKPNMIKELDKLGAQYGDIQNPASAQSMMANDKVQAVLAKFKWDESNFFKNCQQSAVGLERAGLMRRERNATVVAVRGDMIVVGLVGMVLGGNIFRTIVDFLQVSGASIEAVDGDPPVPQNFDLGVFLGISMFAQN